MKISIATRKKHTMKEIKIKDAIIGLKGKKQPVFGSVKYQTPLNRNSIFEIKTKERKITVPLHQLKLVVFKLNERSFGFIFKNQAYFDKQDFNEWDKDTKRLACHELQPNF